METPMGIFLHTKLLKNMKKLLSILTLSTALFSCGVGYHTKQIEKHEQKLSKKGITIPKDTIRVQTTDTLTEIVHKNDTTFITKTVTNTVTLEPIVEYKTRWQVRTEYKTVKIENRAMIDSLQQVLKIERQKTKQVRIENKPKWRGLIWYFIILVVLLAVYLFLTNKK